MGKRPYNQMLFLHTEGAKVERFTVNRIKICYTLCVAPLIQVVFIVGVSLGADIYGGSFLRELQLNETPNSLLWIWLKGIALLNCQLPPFKFNFLMKIVRDQKN